MSRRRNTNVSIFNMILRGARVRAQHVRSLLHRRNHYAISTINQRLIPSTDWNFQAATMIDPRGGDRKMANQR